MRCAEAERQIQLYVDNRLTLAQFRTLEAHIVTCPACQAEFHSLEEITSSLRTIQVVVEPAGLTMQIMQRVAENPRQSDGQYSLWRPSLPELLAVFFLATITTLGLIWNQPSLRAVLPFANGHDVLSHAFFSMLAILVANNGGPLMLLLWVGGAIIGIGITLALVGDEMRTEWYKAMIDRLPVR